MNLTLAQLPSNIAERTKAIQSVIDEISHSGGGRIALGPGTWEVATLQLRSGITFHLEERATLLASTQLELYPRFPAQIDNLEQTGIHLLYAEDAENISLEGPGVIDGQGMHYWKRAESDDQKPYGIFEYYATGDRPSPLIEFARCRNLRIENLTIRNSPSWTLHVCRCAEVLIERIKIRNHMMGPNADGITINGCQDVWVHQCDVRCGDDAINVKAVDPDCVTERIIITDCIAQSNCSCFGTGADVRGVIRNVLFANCMAISSLRMIQMEIWDGGLVENVTFQNIHGSTYPSKGVTCERPIYLDIQQWIKPEIPLGKMRNILISNVTCRTRGRIVMTAQDGTSIDQVTLRDVHLEVPEIEDPEEVVPAARSYQNSNYNPETRAARAAVVADNINGLLLDNVTVRWPESSGIPMKGLVTRNVRNLKNLNSGLGDCPC